MTSGSTSKHLRKERQLTGRQVEEITEMTMNRLMNAPWSTRWRLAFRILTYKDRWKFDLFVLLSQSATSAIGIIIYILAQMYL